MGSYSLFRPRNSAGNGASVWAPDEATAAQVFVTAGRARSLAGVKRCPRLDPPSDLIGRPPRRAGSLRVVELGTDADLGPLDDLERTGTLAWVASDTDPHWVLTPIDLDEETSDTLTSPPTGSS